MLIRSETLEVGSSISSLKTPQEKKQKTKITIPQVITMHSKFKKPVFWVLLHQAVYSITRLLPLDNNNYPLLNL